MRDVCRRAHQYGMVLIHIQARARVHAKDQQQKLKVVIELHEGEKSSTKVWHFLSGRDYIKKGLRLNFLS